MATTKVKIKLEHTEEINRVSFWCQNWELVY